MAIYQAYLTCVNTRWQRRHASLMFLNVPWGNASWWPFSNVSAGLLFEGHVSECLLRLAIWGGMFWLHHGSCLLMFILIVSHTDVFRRAFSSAIAGQTLSQSHVSNGSCCMFSGDLIYECLRRNALSAWSAHFECFPVPHIECVLRVALMVASRELLSDGHVSNGSRDLCSEDFISECLRRRAHCMACL